MHEHEHAEACRDEGRIHRELRHGRRFRHGHGGHHGRGRHGFDPSRGEARGFLGREALLAKLERYQRDLEERTADVADIIRRLKVDEPASPTEVPSTTAV